MFFEEVGWEFVGFSVRAALGVWNFLGVGWF